MGALKSFWNTIVGIFVSTTVETIKDTKEKKVRKKRTTKKVVKPKETADKSKTAKVTKKKVAKKSKEVKGVKKPIINKVEDIDSNEILTLIAAAKDLSTENGKKRYMGRLANNLKKALIAKETEAIAKAEEKITNYLEKNKG